MGCSEAPPQSRGPGSVAGSSSPRHGCNRTHEGDEGQRGQGGFWPPLPSAVSRKRSPCKCPLLKKPSRPAHLTSTILHARPGKGEPLHAGPPHSGCDQDPGASHLRSSPGSPSPRAGCPGLEARSSEARRAELSEARSPSVLGPGQGTFPLPAHRLGLGHPGPFIPRDSGWWEWGGIEHSVARSTGLPTHLRELRDHPQTGHPQVAPLKPLRPP